MSTSPAQGWARSGPGNPCPICGRDDRDGDCRFNSDRIRLICHYGQSLGPPEGMKPGDALDGKDGQRWAFTGATKDGVRRQRKLVRRRHENWSTPWSTTPSVRRQ